MNDWNQQPPSPSGPGEQSWPAPQPGQQPGSQQPWPGHHPAQQPGAQQPWPGQQPGYPPGPPAELPGLTLWLTMPILGVTVLACGVAGLPFNIVALIFAIMAWSARGRGDLDRARKHLRRAKIFSIVGLVLALANIAFGITAAITSGTSS